MFFFMQTNPSTFVSCGDDGVLWTIDVREPKPTKLLVQKDPDAGGRTIAAYTVHANPADDNMVATAGRDPHVRVYDRRRASEENSQPLKKYCPSHLVSSLFVNRMIAFDKILLKLHNFSLALKIKFFILKARAANMARNGNSF